MSLQKKRQDVKSYLQDWMNTKTILRIALFAPTVVGGNLERLRKMIQQLECNNLHAVFVSCDVCPGIDYETQRLMQALLVDTYDRAIYNAHLVVGVNYKSEAMIENDGVSFALGFAAAKRKPTLLVGEVMNGVMEGTLINGFCSNTSDVQRFVDQFEERSNITNTDVRVRAALSLFREPIRSKEDAKSLPTEE